MVRNTLNLLRVNTDHYKPLKPFKIMKQHFEILSCGSIAQIVAKTPKAKKWLQRNVSAESWQWNGNILSIDQRYVFPISEALKEAFA